VEVINPFFRVGHKNHRIAAGNKSPQLLENPRRPSGPGSGGIFYLLDNIVFKPFVLVNRGQNSLLILDHFLKSTVKPKIK
jgi:hypothetical protein